MVCLCIKGIRRHDHNYWDHAESFIKYSDMWIDFDITPKEKERTRIILGSVQWFLGVLKRKRYMLHKNNELQSDLQRSMVPLKSVVTIK